jgi:hypothetical protein
LDATKIVSGVFSLPRVPVAVGVGPAHASGIVPDPGATGDPKDYLARDITFKTMQPPPSYQPAVPEPSITVVDTEPDQVFITIEDTLDGASVFYRLNLIGNFAPAPLGPFFVSPGVTVEAYAAKIGYDNSPISSFTIPP